MKKKAIKTLECPLCHKEVDEEALGMFLVCSKCSNDIITRFHMFAQTMETAIRSSYNMIPIKELPYVDCNCGNGRSLPFDFYTKEKKGKYIVILNTICTKCGGYKEIETTDETMANFQPSNNCPRYVSKEDIIEKQYNELYS
jgi:hypothetical protein